MEPPPVPSAPTIPSTPTIPSEPGEESFAESDGISAAGPRGNRGRNSSAALNAPLPPKPGTPPRLPNVRAINPINVDDKEQQKRLRSNMLVLDSAVSAKGSAGGGKEGESSGDANADFANSTIRNSAAEIAVAKRMSNLSTTIAQGKIINAVLESAVNTDLPGSIRAIVARDVYAESGREVMIPKGSRLIGTYNTGISRGQQRVLIVWTRLLRPDGLDIMIGSPGVDSLGRAGIAGLVDNKYMETFSTAILTSAISIGVAVVGDSLTTGNSTSTSNTDGSSSTTGSGGAAGVATAVNTLGTVSEDIVTSMVDLRPTITIDQGTRISVFVNKDLIFPTSILDSSFVQ